VDERDWLKDELVMRDGKRHVVFFLQGKRPGHEIPLEALACHIITTEVTVPG